MPSYKKSYKRKSRRSYKRKSYRKKPGSYGKMTLNASPYTRQFMPKRYMTKMVWSEKTDVVTAVNTPWFILYSLNGLNDPNKTSGSTHQPMGFDQMTPLYTNYLVTGVKVVFEGSNASAGGHSISVQVGTNGTGFKTDPAEINEYRQSYSIMTSNQAPWKFKKYFSNPAILGDKKTSYDTDKYWGVSGATNPQFGTELYFQIYNIDASEQINTQYTVTFVYYVTWFNPAIIAQS